MVNQSFSKLINNLLTFDHLVHATYAFGLKRLDSAFGKQKSAYLSGGLKMSGTKLRDHGGGLDAAIARYGGDRTTWIDLSTGINPHAFPVKNLPEACWRALPDRAAEDGLIAAARRFWAVPDAADVLAAPGASVLIANMPMLSRRGKVVIPHPTYNEHAAAFQEAGWEVLDKDAGTATVRVLVNPNNPDGRHWTAPQMPAPQANLTIVDESFCDVQPTRSLIPKTAEPGWIVLKSFGKFWGLAGLRLGFAIGPQAQIEKLRACLGPWPVSGPALGVGTAALSDMDWAAETRMRLAKDSARLDAMMQMAGAKVHGGTTLFRLFDVECAAHWQERLARHQIWSRIFPYNDRWLRLGLPHDLHWPRLAAALK
jgi:cobalamin biosynthetic protein CobC